MTPASLGTFDTDVALGFVQGKSLDRNNPVKTQGWIAMIWSDGTTIGLNPYNTLLANYETNRVLFRSTGGGPPEKMHIFYFPVEPLRPQGADAPTGSVSERRTSQPLLQTIIDRFNVRRAGSNPRFVFFIRESVTVGGPHFDAFRGYITDAFPNAGHKVSTGAYHMSGLVAALRT